MSTWSALARETQVKDEMSQSELPFTDPNSCLLFQAQLSDTYKVYTWTTLSFLINPIATTIVTSQLPYRLTHFLLNLPDYDSTSPGADNIMAYIMVAM